MQHDYLINNPTDKTGFWDGLGFALVILALGVAIGGYHWIEKQSGPLIVIKHEGKP